LPGDVVRKVFFSEEKNQKTFISLVASRLVLSLDLAASEGIKVFCFFSSEKKSLPCLQNPRA
jgi:hypothetical protein